ncbi:MAG: response regulator [Lachnospiraceae bacterium]|nr:response regulator [Lachnospiraceae bacterium]MDD3617563.1 response regulator [Lachnospiraceae bacterium]
MAGEKNRKWIGKVFTGMICMLLLIGMIPSVTAAAESEEGETSRRTVKIAFPSQEGMSEVSEDGELTGYNYSYLQELAEYAGWDLEYITYDDMSADDGIMSAMEMVMSGEADLMGPMLKSDGVEEMFDFPKDNYGVVYTTLCALEKSNITSVNYSQYKPLRIAVYQKATTRNQEIKDYLEQLGIEYKIIECESTKEQFQKLEDNEADVLSSITLSHFDGTRSVAEFAPRPYYLATTKGNSELLDELDAATEALNYTRPYLQEELQQQFFGNASNGYVLTEEEQNHIESMDTLEVLAVSGTAPYVNQTKDGQAEGMLVSLLNDFAKENGLEIKYTFCNNTKAMESAWKTGEYDCVIGMPFSSEYCTANDMIRTEAVTSVNLVLYAKQQMDKPLTESKVAVYDHLANLVEQDDYGSVVLFDDSAECFEAVERGYVDYGCADRLRAEYEIFERNSSLVTVPLLDTEEDICIAISPAMGEQFLSAINKYIHTLPNSVKTSYLSEGSRHEAVNGLMIFVRSQPIAAVLLLSAIVVLVLSSFMFAYNASENKKRNIELQKANSAKSEFLSRMSHDIRTPMNAITGYLSIAKSSEECTDKVRHCIDNSEIAAKHLLQLINDVLDMSSIESGKMKIAKEEFDLKREITDVAAIFYQTGKNKGVKFITRVHGLTEEWVTGDPLRINQVVMNLVSNAVKFTSEGGTVELIVEQISEDADTVDIQVTVSDTGIGMSEEYMSRLFQPFEQESAGTAKQFGGSGLGLSIAHNLVSLMGGEMTVESKQNVGTTFTVLMHFEKARQHTDRTYKIPADLSMRVLLVSENEQETEYVKVMIENCGAKADIVTSGAYATKRIRRRNTSDYPYTICILDSELSGMNSMETAKKIRQDTGGKCPAIVVATYDITAVEDEAKTAGVDKVIAKPMFQSSLCSLLMSVIVQEEEVSDKEKNTGNQCDLNGKRIILAEDNEMNLEIAVTVLEKAGLKIDTAENGQEACNLFLASPSGTYDFILMDVQMPVMNGYEATKKIRKSKHSEAKTIPIIAMTANAFAEDVKEAMANGMNAHIAKPVNYEKLFAILDKHLK